VVAPILAKTLEREAFGAVVRRLFPAYYALGMAAAAMGIVSVLLLGIVHETNAMRYLAAGIWLAVLAAETYCRSPLIPRSNAMRDRLKEQESQGTVDPLLERAWNRLHRRSVYLNSLVLLAGLCLLGLVQRW
jgi:4-amino-4-deoxy-L-arabinose transferase-like glycosyltransferase